ncbi:MAG: glycosyltransferase [Xenophilus sp.]
MAEAPAISVALCTRNGARFLEEQVRSICLQSLAPCEIVLSDDASSDDSVSLVRRTVAQCRSECPGLDLDLRVFVNRPALGVTKNFEQAAAACRGELIALCDQDDAWVPDKLRRIADAFAAQPGLLLVHSDARLIDAGGAPLGGTLLQSLGTARDQLERIHGGQALSVYLRYNPVAGATAAFRRALLDPARPFPAEWVHDEWLALIAAALGEVDVIEAPLIDYRQHGGNQIGAGRNSFAQNVRKALASRGELHATRALKAELLLARLLSFGARVDPRCIEQVRGKVAHQRACARLPAARLARLGPVLREAVTGRYGLYGRGVIDIVRNLVEAA